jgi:hypothetical protein
VVRLSRRLRDGNLKLHWKNRAVLRELNDIAWKQRDADKPAGNYGFGMEPDKIKSNTMKLIAIATTAVILSFTPAAILAAESPSPIPSGATSAVAPTATPNAVPTSAAELKPVKRRFLLSHSSAVYKKPDKTSVVVGHVHAKTHVSVTGVTGDWLRIRLSNGKVGFIPSSAAE